MSSLSVVRSFVDALLDLALPSVCATCDGTPGPLCPGCEADLRGALFDRPTRSMPDPPPPGLPPVTTAGPYAGVLRQLVSAYKDDGRRDLSPLLAELLAGPLVAAAAGSRSALLVPVPSSRAAVRRRGDDPVADLVRAAARRADDGFLSAVPVVPCLRPVRRLADQSRLGRRERAANLAGAYAVRTRWLELVRGAEVVLVDDVVTTGATLAEAARAVREGGGQVLGAATLAATQRRHRSPAAGLERTRSTGSGPT